VIEFLTGSFAIGVLIWLHRFNQALRIVDERLTSTPARTLVPEKPCETRLRFIEVRILVVWGIAQRVLPTVRLEPRPTA
jgi:hypothetical protein